jgi:N6-adenosine-specific RNA methylase IME4
MQLDYPTMTVDEIAALDVDAMAADDCALFLWTTQTFLEDAFAVVRAWGFKKSSVLVWCKAPHGWGPGGAFQSTVEFLIYARKGSPRNRKQVRSQWWQLPRGRHSAKPEYVQDMLEEVFPGPYLELFARRERTNWTVLGNEVETC